MTYLETPKACDGKLGRGFARFYNKACDGKLGRGFACSIPGKGLLLLQQEIKQEKHING